MLDAKIAEAVAAVGNATSPAQERKARERKEDFMRLKRVETIYVSLLSVISPLTHLRLERRIACPVRMGTGVTETPIGDCVRWDRATTSSSVINIFSVPSRCCVPCVPLSSVLMSLYHNFI
jgi:hypothetical protein